MSEKASGLGFHSGGERWEEKESIPVTKLGCPGMTASEEETFKLMPEW